MRRFVLHAAWLSATLLLLGCSAIPAGSDPALDVRVRALHASGGPGVGRLAVAPVVTITLAASEAAKGWRPVEIASLEPARMQEQLVRALGAMETWERVRPADDADLAAAWERRDDCLASVEIQDLRTHFDGHNGWWIPNIVNFFVNTPFAWFVAAEDYSLTFDAVISVRSVDSGARVLSRTVPIRVSGSFDEFDRGWQALGPIASSLDAEGWRGIAAKLFPAARTELAVLAASAVETARRSMAGSREMRDRNRKTLVLAVGISRYQDTRVLPPLAYAREDAEAVADAFGRLGALPRHITKLLDGQATTAAVSSAIGELVARAHEDDTIVLYFAGYGATRDGRAGLFLADARGEHGVASLAIEDLTRRLGEARGKSLVLIDAGFGGRGRSLSSATGGAPDQLDALDTRGVTVVLAGGKGDSVLAPDYLGHGLFTHHLVRELDRLSFEERRSRPGLEQLLAALEESVSIDAENLGAHQVPWCAGLADGLEILGSDGGRAP